MSTGKIQYAESNGSFVLKFLGDVRLTLSSTLDKALEAILRQGEVTSVIIDLTETEGIDSTSLGLLAKLSIQSRKLFDIVPSILSTSEDINRILLSMGFDKVFVIVKESREGFEMLKDIPRVECSEQEVMNQVISAHKTLMELNEHNRSAFHDLVYKLEGGVSG